ncbi:hypothetical protein SEA_UNTPL_73 [Streptomyces phage UNTPL]|nr:hypothetical protein SEA_JACKIEB_72 [Streptomyces phage JackieB]AWY07473.1 hypothetical protein SEA_UNTPL_73 [Streptomyces phage UNTPL]
MNAPIMNGNCPRCGAPLTLAGNCSQLCGGAAVPGPVVSLLERPPADPRDLEPVPADVLEAWSDWRELERVMSTPGPVYCSHCGAANPAGSTYCQGCGKMLNP